MSECEHGHSCCPIKIRGCHTHTVDSSDCILCNVAVTTGEVFVWTDNSEDPCWLCVQWKIPTPNLVPHVWRGVHIYCQEQLSGLSTRLA